MYILKYNEFKKIYFDCYPHRGLIDLDMDYACYHNHRERYMEGIEVNIYNRGYEPKYDFIFSDVVRREEKLKMIKDVIDVLQD